ncbi:NAD-dependent epimerase/dehydratase family protein [Iamia sp. SCSIO 61187]|uniref:NAD-dependent epimerase/dehydratase family protein n=1 Tax=Iamia sp. SCSIO 61187 TaxID=2722752 RepID=UPI001C625300|nr:NAD-dependent epimerase/dehydratase family protein [Iamia sp. SCSIO 61187]QYG93115.1 NAD-dependent epimerase/dehydratase family protein [Iamia sp. SCSIO 61187]
MPGSTITVTGASGNVGAALLDVLDTDPRVAEVRALSRRPPEQEHRAKVRWFGADITVDDLEPAVVGADALVHLAWLIQPSWDVDAQRRTNVDGSARVFAAAVAAGVPALVHASSVGAYAAGPKDRTVDESWPLGGHPHHPYSRHKAEVEGLLDTIEADHPTLRVVRMRPALIFQERAGLELKRYFLPRLPGLPAALRPSLVDRVPTRFQVVHAIDVARAFAEAALGSVSGAFNLATDDVVGGRHVPALRLPARAAASLTWRAHLQPVDPGWVRLVFGCPLLDSSRARDVLGWSPAMSGHEALAEGLEGMRTTRRAPTAALRGEGAPPEAGS